MSQLNDNKRKVEISDNSGQTKVLITIELKTDDKPKPSEALNTVNNNRVALMCLNPDAANSTVYWQADLTSEQIEAISKLNNKVPSDRVDLSSLDNSKIITVLADDLILWLTDPLYHDMSPVMRMQKEMIMECVPHLRGVFKNQSHFGDWDGNGVGKLFIFCNE